jgi:hypothetical protein
MLIAFSLLICLVGLLMYALAANPKVNTLGFSMFEIGLLAFLLCLCLGGGEHLTSLLPK